MGTLQKTGCFHVSERFSRRTCSNYGRMRHSFSYIRSNHRYYFRFYRSIWYWIYWQSPENRWPCWCCRCSWFKRCFRYSCSWSFLRWIRHRLERTSYRRRLPRIWCSVHRYDHHNRMGCCYYDNYLPGNQTYNRTSCFSWRRDRRSWLQRTWSCKCLWRFRNGWCSDSYGNFHKSSCCHSQTFCSCWISSRTSERRRS